MHGFSVQIGPASFRIGSAWKKPIDQLRRLYSAYPLPLDGVADFTVRLEASRPWRRWLRPAVNIAGDFMLPDAAPLPLEQALLAAEMGMNLQMALGWKRHLLLHASCVERDGRALVMTGASGSGKSTLAAMLGERGWRLMGDEFALLDPVGGRMFAFPRLISLKNGAIDVMQRLSAEERFGPLLAGTPKGDIRHLAPGSDAVERMEEGAAPAMLLFPRFGYAPAIRPMAKSESFVRLTQASTNYVALGEAGFTALSGFVDAVPAHAIDFGSGSEALDLVDRLWAEID